jgi:hypothetical protein
MVAGAGPESDLQCLRKVHTLLDSFHILLCFSLNLKWITFRFSGHLHTHNTLLFLNKLIKHEKLKCLESISIQALCYDKPK